MTCTGWGNREHVTLPADLSACRAYAAVEQCISLQEGGSWVIEQSHSQLSILVQQQLMVAEKQLQKP